MKTRESLKNDFVISLAGENIDITIINIEEMDVYCHERKRFASVVTQKQTYGAIEKLNYSLLMNYKNPKPRVIITKNKPFLHVYTVLSEKYNAGLLIAESDTLSDPISDHLCKKREWENNDIDIMICRSFASVTDDELRKANLLRISADPDFNPMVLERIGEILQEVTGAVMIAQLFVNNNYDKTKSYIDQQSERMQEAGIKEFINYYDLRKQLAYFVYVDLCSGKIIGPSKESLMEFMKSLPKEMLPMDEEHVNEFANMISL